MSYRNTSARPRAVAVVGLAAGLAALLLAPSALAAEPDEKQQAIFDQGNEVGLLAQKAFSSGTLISEDHMHHKEAVTRTKELIADKSIPAIFEAAFSFEDILIRVDILEQLPRDCWRLKIRPGLVSAVRFAAVLGVDLQG